MSTHVYHPYHVSDDTAHRITAFVAPFFSADTVWDAFSTSSVIFCFIAGWFLYVFGSDQVTLIGMIAGYSV